MNQEFDDIFAELPKNPTRSQLVKVVTSLLNTAYNRGIDDMREHNQALQRSLQEARHEIDDLKRQARKQ
jgi:FtsZ-binding cell division protein ZapB